MARSTIEQLRERVAGQVVTSQDQEYETARVVYNAMIDRHPRVVVRCVSTDDVTAAVNHARESGLSSRSAAAVTACQASAPSMTGL